VENEDKQENAVNGAMRGGKNPGQVMPACNPTRPAGVGGTVL